MLERTAYYNRLTPQSVAELKALSTKLGADAIQKVVGAAIRLEDQDAASASATQRMTFGVYFYTEPTRAEASPTQADQKPAPATPKKRK